MFHPSPVRPHRQPSGFWTFWATLLAACALLVACGGGGGETSSAPDPSGAVTQTVGAEGGTVTGPDGVQVVIPPGALEANTAIGIARSSAGAPTALEGYPALGPVYEFTPHGIVFNEPVTIRLPIQSADTKVFMASRDEDWNDTAFAYNDGMAEFQRNGFSWSYGANLACSYNPNDPNLGISACVWPDSNPTVSATPAAALVSAYAGGLPSNRYFTLNQAALLHFRLELRLKADCTNATATLARRVVSNGQWSSPVTVAQHAVNLAISGNTPGQHADGNTSFDLAMTDQDNGRYRFELISTCTRHNVRTVATHREIPFTVNIPAVPPPPATSFPIGGTLIGLTGTGLVLQNNAGDNLALAANGSFQFATLVGNGNAYNVTVLTQPSGQTCSVQNGSGSALAGVTTVAVACTNVPIVVSGGTKAWQSAAPLTPNNVTAYFPHVSMDASGFIFAVWVQADTNNQTHIWAKYHNPSIGWSTARRVDTGSGSAEQPEVAMDGTGYAQVVWRQVDENRTWSIYSSRFSGSWGPVSVVETNSNAVHRPRIAFDASDHRFVAWWEQFDGSGSANPGVSVSRYDPATTSWSTATSISGSHGTDTNYGPHLAISSNGEAFAVWSGDGIWSNHYHPRNGWGTATKISSGQVYGDANVAVDANGHAMAVWAQFTDGSGSNDITVVANQISSGSWGTPEQIDTNYSAGALSPKITMQANGDAMVVWVNKLGSVQTLWARNYVSGIWGNPQLLDPAAAISDSADIRNSQKISFDGLGNAMLVWVTGPNHSVQAQRYEANIGWGHATSLTNAKVANIQLALDPQGNAIAVWDETSDGITFSPVYDLFRAPPP